MRINISLQAAPEKPRERSRSKSGAKGRARSGSPPSTKIHIGRLTRNVNREHLQEIFSTFGKIREIEFGSERMRPWLNKGLFKDRLTEIKVSRVASKSFLLVMCPFMILLFRFRLHRV